MEEESTSFLTCSGVGISRYLIVLIPALASMASRSASLSFLLSCVQSSNSITAITKKPGLQITKSAYFLSYRLRMLWFPFGVVIRACMLTCERTWNAGSSKATFSTINIFCSRFVSGNFRSALKGLLLFMFFKKRPVSVRMTNANKKSFPIFQFSFIRES